MFSIGSSGAGSPSPRTRPRCCRLQIVGSIVGLVAAVAGAVAFCWRPPAPAKVNVATHGDLQHGDDLDEPPVVNPGYLGAQACAACHAERVAEFRATNHYRTFRVPEADVMPAGFAAGRGLYRTKDPSLRFEMTRSGNDFFQTSIRTTSGGEEQTKSRIDLVLGAGGKADEVYLTWREDRLYELPMAWLYTFDRWGCSHISPFGSGDFGRESTLRCLECHNTWFEHLPGTRNQYKPGSFILGVTCENCHGPGREHVAFHEAHRESDSSQSIVKPARLTRERQLDLCTQCHSNAIRHKGPALNHRAGEPLEAHYKTLVAPTHTEDDHVANQIKYLRQSKCFQMSDDMTCTTCHNPHRPERLAAHGIDSCRKCHNDADCSEQSRLPAAVRTTCVGCHMPHYIKINVNFETEDDNYVPPIRRCDHRIAIHPRAQQEVLLDWYRQQTDPQSLEEVNRLTRSLVDDWLAEAEACRHDYRFMGAIAAIREADRLDPAPATREKLRQAVAIKAKLDRESADANRQVAEHQYPQAIQTLNSILRVKPDDAAAHGKLGTALAAMGHNELAIEHWEAVVKYDPDDPYGYAMLGWLAYLQNRFEESVEAYRRADEVEPYLAPINYHWSLALAKLGRWEEAAERFRHVLTIDPKHAGGQQGLAHALQIQGHAAEALGYARRAARLTNFQNADVLLTLTDVYADLGRFAEAADAASKALDAAQASAPNSVPQIRQRLQKIRARARASGR